MATTINNWWQLTRFVTPVSPFGQELDCVVLQSPKQIEATVAPDDEYIGEGQWDASKKDADDELDV